jgi:arsenate reductase
VGWPAIDADGYREPVLAQQPDVVVPQQRRIRGHRKAHCDTGSFVRSSPLAGDARGGVRGEPLENIVFRRRLVSEKIYNVLFLCTGNSARSILAEVLLEHWGGGRFRAYSAGSFPKGAVHPLALDLLEKLELPTGRLRSKSWNEFARPGAPVMDFVFTVCDQAAGEVCPVWPGNLVTAHWGVPDPAAVQGTEAEQRGAFREAYVTLENRIKLLVALPIQKLDRLASNATSITSAAAVRPQDWSYHDIGH